MQIHVSHGGFKPEFEASVEKPASRGYPSQTPYLSVWIKAARGGGYTTLALKLDEAEALVALMASHLSDLSVAVSEHAETLQTPDAAVTPVAAASGQPAACAP